MLVAYDEPPCCEPRTRQRRAVLESCQGELTPWSSHAAELWALLGQHIALVLVSTLVAIAIGVPIGIVAARRPRIGGPLAAAASVIQTVPSLALFGFLLPLPLVGGVGARTALAALILYALLPVIRTTAAGLQSSTRPFSRRLTRWG